MVRTTKVEDPPPRQFWSNFHFLISSVKVFFQLSLRNNWVFVQKVSLTANLWQLLDRGRTHKLKSVMCIYTFWRLLNRNESKNKRFFTKSCGPLLAPPPPHPERVVVSATQNYHYFFSTSPLRWSETKSKRSWWAVKDNLQTEIHTYLHKHIMFVSWESVRLSVWSLWN